MVDGVSYTQSQLTRCPHCDLGMGCISLALVPIRTRAFRCRPMRDGGVLQTVSTPSVLSPPLPN